MTIGYSTAIRNARLNVVRDALDAGAGPGVLEIYSGGRPPTGATITPSAWQAVQAYIAGDIRQPTTPNGHYYRCTVPGTSGASEPVWPTDGSTVIDGGVTWRDAGTLPVLLGTLTFSDPSAPAAADGILTFSPIAEDAAADAIGTATWARTKDSTGAFVADFSVTVSGGGGDIQLNTVSIVTGGPIQVSSAKITAGNP